MSDDKFWMVYGKNEPTHKHLTFEEAKAEAERLASRYPHIVFYVLESVGFARAVQNPIEYVNIR